MQATSSAFSLFMVHLMTIFSTTEPTVKPHSAPIQMAAQPTSAKMIEEATHQYLIKHPEVIAEALQAYQMNENEMILNRYKETNKVAVHYSREIFFSEAVPQLGNPNGTVTLVEFSDYQCSHCFEVSPSIDALIHTNPNLRIVIKEFAIRGPISDLAARAALAAKKQDKYKEFREALFKAEQPLTEAKIYTVAQSIHLNVEKLKADMSSPEIKNEVEDNKKLAIHLKLMGTPVFFIARTNPQSRLAEGDIRYVPGVMGLEQLQDIIRKISG